MTPLGRLESVFLCAAVLRNESHDEDFEGRLRNMMDKITTRVFIETKIVYYRCQHELFACNFISSAPRTKAALLILHRMSTAPESQECCNVCLRQCDRMML